MERSPTALIDAPATLDHDALPRRHAPARRISIRLAGAITAELVAGIALAAIATGAPGADVAPAAIGVSVALLLVRGGLGLGADRAAGGAAAVLLCAIRTAVAIGTLDSAVGARSVVALLALTGLPIVCALAVPIAVPRMAVGERDALVTGIGTATVAIGLGAIAVVVVGGVWAPVDLATVEPVLPYVAGAAGLLAFAETLARHHVGAGFASLVTPLTGLALVAQVGALVVLRTSPVDEAATSLLVGGAIVAVGLGTATLFASPKPFVISDVAVSDGPRLVGPVLVALVALASVVRLLAVRPVWLDEAALIEAARAPFGAVWRSPVAHPPLFETMLGATGRIVDANALLLRLPSIALGVVLVLALYAAGTELFGRRAGLIAAVIGALGPGLVWMSVRIGPGMLAALLATLSVLGFTRWTRHVRGRDWLLFTGAGVLLVWTHQLGFVHAFVLVLAGGFVVARAERRARLASTWVLSALTIGVAFAALLVVRNGFGPQHAGFPLEYATIGAPSGGQTVLGLGGTALSALIGFHPPDVTSRLLALWPFCMVAAFVALGRRWSREGALVVALAAAPFAALVAFHLAGVPRRPPLALGWVATAVPMLVLLVAQGLSAITGDWRRTRLVVVVLVAVLAVGLVDQGLRTHTDRTLDVPATLDRVERRARPGDAVLFSPRAVADLVDFRLPRLHDRSVVAARASDPALTAPRVFVVEVESLEPSRAERVRLRALMRQLGATRTLVRTDEAPGRTVWEFR